MTAQKLLCRVHAHLRRHNAVAQIGVSASDDVSQTGKFGFYTGLCLDLLCQLGGVVTAHTLGYDDDEITLSDLAGALDPLAQRVVVVRELRHDNRGCTRCDSGVQRDVAGASAHYLDYVTSGVRLAGIAQLVDELDDGVHRGIEADGVVGGGDVVINSAGDTYAGNAVSGQVGSASEGAVAAQRHDAVDAEAMAGVYRLLHALLGLELGAAVGIKYRAALVDDVGNVAHAEGLYISVDKSRVSAINSHDLNATRERGTGNGSDSGVHSGCIAAGGKYAYSSEFFHN